MKLATPLKNYFSKLKTRVFSRKSSKRLAVLVVVFLTIFGILFNPFNKAIDAAWFNDNWLYRQRVAITNSSGSVQTEFQVMATVDTSTLITAGKMQSDCDDIRFTDYNGKQLPYWIEPSTCNTSTTKIWVKVASIAVSSANILMYYGNSQAVSASSTSRTFIREISDVAGAWNLDESSGNASDTSGNGTTLTNTNSAAYAAGKYNNGASLTAASSQYFAASSNSNVQTGDIDFTVSGWFNSTTLSGNQYIIAKYPGSSPSNEYTVYTDGVNSRLVFLVTDSSSSIGSVTTANSSLATDTWYYFVAWHDSVSNTLNIQLNNGTVSSATHTTGVRAGSAAFSLGANGSAQGFFNGKIDEVRLYKRLLTSAERTDLYGSGSDRQGYTTTNYPGKELVRKFNASVSVASPTSEEKAPSPVAHWRFDEGTGTTAKDATSNGNNGTLGTGSSAPTWQTEDQCISGKCLRFDGTNDYVQIQSTNFSATSGTMSTWVYPTSSTGDRLLIMASTNPNRVYALLQGTTNNLLLSLGSTLSVNTQKVIPTNAWSYISITWNNGTYYAYVNGVQVATGSYSGLSSISSCASIGVYSNCSGTINSYFQGKLDDAKIYNYARSASQIKTDYNARGDVKGISTALGEASPDGSTLSNGLVGYWKMDESSWNGTSNEVVDSSGVGNHGTSLPSGSAPTTTTGKFGNGGNFDGTNDYVSKSSPSNLTFNTAFTLSSWVKTSDTGGTIAGRWDGLEYGYKINLGASGAAGCITDNGKAWIVLDQNVGGGTCDAGRTSVNAVNDNQWHHIVGVYDGPAGILKLYVDGVESTAALVGTVPTSIASQSRPFYIGGEVSNNFMLSGLIDEVRAYNRALSPAEVAQLYNYAPGPVAYYDFEEASGTSTNDKSGNGNTGTLTNGPTWTNGKVGNAVNFDGSDDHVTFPITTLGSDVTFSAWVKPSNLNNSIEALFGAQQGANSVFASVRSTGEVTWRTAGSSTFSDLSTTGAGIQVNQWVYLTFIKDSSGRKIYINGILKASDSSSEWVTTISSASIGMRSQSSLPFPGIIDEFKYYNYARTQKQIQEDMLAGGSLVSTQKRINSSGIVGYWKFDEGQGTTANDSSGKGKNLTLSTASWTASGKFNKAWNGLSSNWLSYPDDDLFDFAATDDFTLSLWIKSDSDSNPASTQCILCKTNMANIPGYAINVDTSGIVFFGIDDDTAVQPEDRANSPTDIYDANWHHIVARKIGTSRIDLFIDGKLLASKTTLSATGSLVNSLPLYIGDRDGSNAVDEFAGDIDELKIYRHALTESEVRQDYNRGASQVLGSRSTTAAGVNDNSSERAYCPPGDTTATCSPVAEWNFEEGSGSSLKDSSGNENTATIVAGGTFTPGKNGKALRLDGTNNDVTAASSSTLNIGTSDFTLQGWIKGKAMENGDCILCKTNGGGASSTYGFHWSVFDSLYPTLHFATSATAHTKIQGQQALVNNRWYHVAVVVDRDSTTNTKVYIDGKPVTTSVSNLATNTGSITNSVVMAFGRESDDDYDWNGDLDQMRIYNYARSAAEVAWDYNKGAPVAQWKLDECEGTTVNDSSGNGNTGTVSIGASGTQTSAGTCATSSTAWGNGVNGKKNYSLNFDGTDDYVSTNLTIPGPHMTASAWIKPSSSTVADYSRILSTDDGVSAYSFVLAYGATGLSNANKIRMLVTTNNGTVIAVSSSSLNDTTKWYHVTGVYDGTAVKIYVNGKLEQSTAQTGAISNNLNLVNIGRNVNAQYPFAGQIDDVRIYNYPLSSSQVKTLYTDGAVNFAPITGAP